jgi:hypothetical protein
VETFKLKIHYVHPPLILQEVCRLKNIVLWGMTISIVLLESDVKYSVLPERPFVMDLYGNFSA